MSFDLNELLKYLGLHGWQALLVVGGFFILWLVFSNDKASTFLAKKIVEKFSAIISSIHKEKQITSEKMSREIDLVLHQLREDTDATNALVVRYRNGNFDSIGSSILKFYATNEKTKPGFLQIGDKIQEISRSLYGDFCDTLLKEHKVYIKDKTSITDEDAELQSVMKLFGQAEKFYAHSLVTTSDHQIVGFVCLVYTEPQKVAESRVDAAITAAAERIVGKLELTL